MSVGFEGDPKIFIDKDGAELDYRDGQPVMDQGLENHDVISLLTEPGWVGNDLFPESQAIGSDFSQAVAEAITATSLVEMEDAAARALESGIAQTDFVEVEISNPSGSRLDILIRRSPPAGDVESFLLTRDGSVWINQAQSPASGR